MNCKKLSKIVDMANVLKEDTGLNYDVRISSKEGRHGPRIRVYLENIGDDSLSVSIGNTPKVVAGDSKLISAEDLDKVNQWILKNKQTLLDYWYADRPDTLAVLNTLKSI